MTERWEKISFINNSRAWGVSGEHLASQIILTGGWGASYPMERTPHPRPPPRPRTLSNPSFLKEHSAR